MDVKAFVRLGPLPVYRTRRIHCGPQCVVVDPHGRWRAPQRTRFLDGRFEFQTPLCSIRFRREDEYRRAKLLVTTPSKAIVARGL